MKKRIVALVACGLLVLTSDQCSGSNGGGATPQDTAIPACTDAHHHESPCPQRVHLG